MKGTKGVVKMKDQKESKETQTENQKNTKARIITIFVCLLLTISALIGPLTPDHYYSEREKRNLTQMPIPDLEDIFSGDFADSLEDYLTDQVPLRDRWIAVKTYAELAVGKRESGGVYIGKDHYLMDKFSTYSTKQLRINAAALADLQTAAARNHIRMQTMLVPVAAQMLTDKLPPFASAAAYETILSALQEQGVSTIDLAKVLSTHTSEDIYYRTDHHWTSLGAYYTYTAWMQVLSRQNEIIPQTEWTKETLCENFRGTTWNKVPLHGVPADSITAWYRHADRKVSYNDGQMQDTSLYTRKYLSGSDQYGLSQLQSGGNRHSRQWRGRQRQAAADQRFLRQYLRTVSERAVRGSACTGSPLLARQPHGLRKTKRHHRPSGPLRNAELRQ